MSSNPVSWITSLPTVYSILISQPTANITPLKQLLHPRLPHQCNGITENIMPLPTRPLCCFRHYWPWHLDHPSLILVWYPWLCSQLVQIISVISLHSCKMWNRPVRLAHFLLRCPPRLCPWSTTLRHVHHSSQYPHFLLFPKPSPIPRTATDTSEHIRFFSLLLLFSTVSFPRCRLILLM